MHYLHTRRPPIIHGDLRSPNLLLDMTIDNEGPRFHLKVGSSCLNNFGHIHVHRYQRHDSGYARESGQLVR